MNKKAKTIISISVLVLIVASISAISIINSSLSKTEKYDVTYNQKMESYKFLKENINKISYTYYDFLNDNSIDYTLDNAEGNASNLNVVDDIYNYQGFNENAKIINLLNYGDSLDYYVNVNKAGLYEINIDYLIKGENILTAPNISIKINDAIQYSEASSLVTPLIWKGTEGISFPLDSYGDETIPLNERDDTSWQSLDVYDTLYSSSKPLLFKLNEGENKICVTYVSGTADLLLANLSVKAPDKSISYAEYKALYSSYPTIDSLNAYNSIYYNSKNSSYICLGSEKSPNVTPYSTSKNHINMITVDSYDDAGQAVTYKINVEQDGLYNLAFHYQNDKNEFNVFRSIYIDGEVPFEECYNYEFKPTKSGGWANETLKINNEDMLFYLSKGDHYLTIKAEREKIYNLTSEIQQVIDHINYFSLEILKVTGSEIDKDRTWKLTESIPNTAKYLSCYDIILKSIMNEASKYSSKELDSATLSYIKKAIVTLKKLQKDPDELPLYLENLYSGSSSVNQLLGSSITTLNEQPMGLDMIYVYNNKKLPKDNAGVFKQLGASIATAYNSYTSNKYDTSNDENAVNVWINKPLTYINILQQMVDRDFNSKENMPNIKISMMPDPSKLLLSTSAGESPDVALGIASYTPFDFAIRNAAYDLSSFTDFYDVASRFPSGTLVPFVLNDRFYALPESLDFQVTLYRKDIFDSFTIPLPDTWEDLKDILHILQQYGMNYYLPTSAENSTKWFYQTSPMIYQYGGKLYNDDGLTTAIDNEEALKGLTLLTDLYKYYSLDSQVKSFYNSFRYGTHPIGTANFSEYLLVKNAAPEIIGKWEISSPLGVLKENGIVDRTYISNGSSAMIFKSTSKANESWEFLKWWTSTSVQIEYSNRLQSTYGPEYTWLSSNIEAVKEAPLDSDDKEVIIESFNWITDIPRTPGQYMLERGLSNIWTSVALQNEPIGVTIDNEVILINREINRKMKEFDYLDDENNIIKPYTVREKDWVYQTIMSNLSGGDK